MWLLTLHWVLVPQSLGHGSTQCRRWQALLGKQSTLYLWIHWCPHAHELPWDYHHSLCPGALSLMDETSFLIKSNTALLLFARACQVSESRGFAAGLIADCIIAQESAIICFPVSKIGIYASLPKVEILAGTEATSGELANWQRLSTASIRSRVELVVACQFSSV